MNRRTFMASMGAMAASGWVSGTAPAAEPRRRSASERPARKVVVGTTMRAFWNERPALPDRLELLSSLVDQMAVQARSQYGRGLDLAVLPETAVSGEAGGEGGARAIPLAGPFQETFGRKAREHGCYLIAPTYLLESKDGKQCSNAAVLFDRRGEVTGIYRKIHLVVAAEGGTMEAGATPGAELPVFDCDFGRLGIQICYDIEFEDSWRELARRGAELVAWPTQSPQTAQPAFRAQRYRYYVVSSTWRHNASIFEPTGKIVAQIKPPQSILVHPLDLSYAILPWSLKLQNGEALRKAYGERVGFHYYEDEDRGIFWSNDPALTIGEMVRSVGVRELEDEMERVRQCYAKAGVPTFGER